jgi:hypothetical protein
VLIKHDTSAVFKKRRDLGDGCVLAGDPRGDRGRRDLKPVVGIKEDQVAACD